MVDTFIDLETLIKINDELDIAGHLVTFDEALAWLRKAPQAETLEDLEGEDPHAIDQYLRTGGPNV